MQPNPKRTLLRRVARKGKRVRLKVYRRVRGIFGPTTHQISMAAIMIFDEARINARKVTAKEKAKFVKDRGSEPTEEELHTRTIEEINAFARKLVKQYAAELVIRSVFDARGQKRIVTRASIGRVMVSRFAPTKAKLEKELSWLAKHS